ncbi:DNA polymerase III subunit beta [Candidatus Marinimicrobia bacterium]|nr:DNA polymerase III subunit beta [Candidatus Neomarinimicrobiota bacterium]
MKYSTSKNELQSALQKLSKAVPNRSTLPILSCVLIEVSDSGVLLRSTDLEITITTSLESSIEKQGIAAIPLQPLLDIAGELPDDTRIEMEANDKNIKINTDFGTYDLMGKDPEEYPAAPDINNDIETGIDSPLLNKIISTVSFAVSKDDLKPALTGVFFKVDSDLITAVATDGHRLAQFLCKNKTTASFTGEVIIPKKFLNTVGSYISGKKDVLLLINDSVFTAKIGKDTIYTRIIDEKFPDYESVIPKDNDKELQVDRKELLAAVKRVSIFSNKTTQQVAMKTETAKLLITTEDPEKASKAQEVLSVSYESDSIEIGFNASYLKDVLSHLTSDNITLKLNTPISASLFYPNNNTEDEKTSMLLMPIRLNE